MRKQRLITFALAVMTALTIWGAPAMPGTRQVKQADGTLLTIEQWGDEFHHWVQTPDGMLVMERNGYYFVADIDEQGRLTATDVLAHDKPLRTLAETLYLRQQQLRKDRFLERGMTARRAAMVNTSGGYLPHTGSPRVLVVLAEYQDLPFTVNNPLEAFDQYLNGTEQKDLGNKNNKNTNSIRQYFDICSHGAFTPQFDVVGPVTLPENMAYYGAGDSNSEKMSQMAKDAIALLPDSIDLSAYDNNNDGAIELMYVIHAGYGQNQGGDSNAMWAKVSTVNTRINESLTLTRFGCNCELFYPHPNFKNNINGTGVFCHEFSHAMGLPDLYPTNSAGRRVDNQSMEKWDVMDYGLYLNNSYSPMPYIAWEQEAMGWQEIETLTANHKAIHDSIMLMPTLEEGGKAYKILNPEDDNEFIVIENVQKRNIYEGIVNSGLLMYHVAYPYSKVNMGDNPNNTAGEPAISLVPACGIGMSGYLRQGQGYGDTHTSEEYENNQKAVIFPGTQDVTQLSDDDQLPNYKFYTSQNNGRVGVKISDINGDASTGLMGFYYTDLTKVVKGDVNYDALIDVEDVVAVVNYILGEHDMKFLPEAADVNGDNKIDVDDVVAIVNKILESSQAEEITNE